MFVLKDRDFSARDCLERHSLDAMLVTGLPNIRYLCGFSGTDGVLLLTSSGGCFLTDSRYTTQALAEVGAVPVIECKVKLDAVAERIMQSGCRRLGFEAFNLSVALHAELAEKLPGVELVPIKTDLDELRETKDPEEIGILATCAEIASSAFQEIIPLIREGAVERELALELEIAMRRRGADDKSFDFIVASGERGALPHGRASERRIGSGELVTFDYGAVYRGYASDETVTVAVGEPNGKLRRIYDTVKEAHDRAIAAVRPGVSLPELDRIARSYIEEQGFGPFFGHGLGHGVGLEVHERPTVSFRSTSVAAEGMVFTVEPGIYIPGLGGVRIEDTVVVTSDGCRIITKVPKDLQVL